MSKPEKIGVRFTDKDQFGKFCIALRDDDVPFQLAGFRTVVIAKTDIDQLPKASAQLYQLCKQKNYIEDASPIVSTGVRHLPTAQETEKLLKQLAAEF